MLALNISRLPSDITTILTLRGKELPPLQWQNYANKSAKAALDALHDDMLFGKTTVRNEGMASAVRSLLYLWNGWLTECVNHAKTAPEPERLYIKGLCERMAGRAAEAKAIFQEMGEHPVHPSLMQHAMKVISSGTDAAAKRFREIMELGKAWETFAFIDLYEQARADKLCTAMERAVCHIQRKEFELLFCHCYREATGVEVSQIETSQEPIRRPSKLRKRPQANRQPPKSTKPAGGKSDEAGKKKALANVRVGIACPKCRVELLFPESARGKRAKCNRCDAVFLVPEKTAAGAISRPIGG